MPNLCYIYKPIYRTCSNREYFDLRRHNIWDLTRQIVRFKGTADAWECTIDDYTLSSEKLYDLKHVVSVIAARNGGFTDYAEAKRFIARKNA